jgi:DNA-damage-inducible protein D
MFAPLSNADFLKFETNIIMENNALILFEDQHVRRVWHNDEWYFVINDVIQVLTDSTNPRQYFQNLKRREPEFSKGGVQIEHPLLVPTEGGSQRMNCANRQSLLRLIMAIPSPKAEPFKLWLAQVGEQHIQEIENPELGIERIRELYKAKGYTDEWIESRLKTIDIRKQLTDEWQQRGVTEGQEYAILTAEIAKATFGLTPSEHKNLKNLDRQNLRDHMTGLELIFTMLGEEATRTVVVRDDAQGFTENHDAAIRGGRMAGNARKSFEATENVKVVTDENFLNQIENATKTIENPPTK